MSNAANPTLGHRADLGFQLPSGQPRGLVFLAAAVTFLLGSIIVMRWPLTSTYVLE